MAAQSLGLDTLFRVEGMVALVTGGGTGIGLLMARALAEAGAKRVYILGRRESVIAEAAASINLPSVVPVQCDVSSKASLENIVKVVEAAEGYLNLLICNAGIGGPQVKAPVPGTTLDEWREQQLSVPMEEFARTFHVNTTAVWYTAMACLKLLDNGNKEGNLEQNSQIIVTSSIAGFNRKAPGGWAYGQSKAAVNHLVKQLGVTLTHWDIRTNCIAPGLFPSEMSAPIVQAFGGTPGQPLALDKSVIPLGKMGDDRDMAGAVLYLASRAGAYVNGNILIVDGGRLGTFPSTY